MSLDDVMPVISVNIVKRETISDVLKCVITVMYTLNVLLPYCLGKLLSLN